MKIWIRKTFVVLIAMLTLGLYIPPVSVYTEADESKEGLASNSDIHENETSIQLATLEEPDQLTELEHIVESPGDDYLGTLTYKAREQVMAKFGPRITEQVGDEFTESILPVMEEVLKTILNDADEVEVPYYAITENPTRGLGERIFDVVDERTQKDIARFHVRRDNRPLEGYWFNFHYHLSSDNFEKHHEIGEIYWDKNIPPKWMSS